MAGREELAYGIVFGFTPNARKDLTIEIFEADESGNLFVSGTDARDAREFFEKIAEVHNKTTDSVLTYHNGHTDQSCQYHGHHWHWVVNLRCHPTRDARWGRKCLELTRQPNLGVFFASQRAADAFALVRHIRTHPRLPICERGEKFTFGRTGESTSLTQETLEADMRAKLRRDPNYFKIEFLEKAMMKYMTPDIGNLRQHMFKNKEEWAQFRELQAMASYDVIVKKAQEMFRAQHITQSLDEIMKNKRVLDKYGSFKPPPGYLTTRETINMIQKFCIHNGFLTTSFLDNLFDVLTKALPKVNTFVLQGEANSGKSWILRSLLPWFMFFGEVRAGTGYNFLWQDCLDTSLIFVEELMITQDIVEQCKLVFEGASTAVHVKCKGDQLLNRTPVLVTCNHSMWKWCQADMKALKARCFHYMTKQWEDLKACKKKANPAAWHQLYVEYVARNKSTLTSSSVDEGEVDERTNEIAWERKQDPTEYLEHLKQEKLEVLEPPTPTSPKLYSSDEEEGDCKAVIDKIMKDGPKDPLSDSPIPPSGIKTPVKKRKADELTPSFVKKCISGGFGQNSLQILASMCDSDVEPSSSDDDVEVTKEVILVPDSQ